MKSTKEKHMVYILLVVLEIREGNIPTQNWSEYPTYLVSWQLQDSGQILHGIITADLKFVSSCPPITYNTGRFHS